MSNITMTLDDEIIRKVKKIAIDRNTTLTLHRSDKLTHLCSDKLSRWFTPETLNS